MLDRHTDRQTILSGVIGSLFFVLLVSIVLSKFAYIFGLVNVTIGCLLVFLLLFCFVFLQNGTQKPKEYLT